MNKRLFGELVERMIQMNEIARGERAPSRELHVESFANKEQCAPRGGQKASKSK